eukprot:3731067-Prymnesium_polylepis.1
MALGPGGVETPPSLCAIWWSGGPEPDVTTPVRVRLQRSAAARAGRRRGGPVSELNVEQRDDLRLDHTGHACSPMPAAPRAETTVRQPLQPPSLPAFFSLRCVLNSSASWLF